MEKVMLIPSNNLTATDIKKLESKGFLVIITDEPEKIRLLEPTMFSGSGPFLAALEAISQSKVASEAFPALLLKALTKSKP